MEGSNVGAKMSVELPEEVDCGCINVYVNSNIQGMNNSVASGGSAVIMGDPGVRVHFHQYNAAGNNTSDDDCGFGYCRGTIIKPGSWTFCIGLMVSIGLQLFVIWKLN